MSNESLDVRGQGGLGCSVGSLPGSVFGAAFVERIDLGHELCDALDDVGWGAGSDQVVEQVVGLRNCGILGQEVLSRSCRHSGGGDKT